MKLPPALVQEISRGDVVLLLGAGASKGARNSAGVEPPSGDELAKALSTEFLGGAFSNNPLAQVSELAVSESDLVTVQRFIAELLDQFHPAAFHSKLADFMWRGIATTNYDCIIERAYDANRSRLQDPVPFIRNDDKVDDKLRALNSLALIKLHGSITLIDDPNTPLLLTIDQYITHRNYRQRLFQMLYEWGSEHPVVFVGQRLTDSDLRQLLQELSSSITSRPQYYTITPGITDIEARYWDQRGVTCISGNLEDFLVELEQAIPLAPRRLAAAYPVVDYPVQRHFTNNRPISAGLRDFLDVDFEYVTSPLSANRIEPSDFYAGYGGGWAPILQDLDVRREIGDTILADVVLSPSSEPFQFYAIKAYAGAGKSVLMRRLAWEAATNYDSLCLVRRPHGRLTFAPLADLCHQTDKRIFVFVDHVGEIVQDAITFVQRARRARYPITLIVTERSNVWNVSCEGLDPFLDGDFELPYLEEKELEALLGLLEQHHSLGHLASQTTEERMSSLRHKAGRQLLVALHEATLGKPLELIIKDEYEQITPLEARSIYLGICALNQFGVPVRAGLVSRVFGVNFTEFQRRFFKPLEHVVYPQFDDRYRDYVYTARHPHIAEMVTRYMLTAPVDRLDLYLAIIKHMNLAFETDRTAFRRLIHARTVLDLFTDDAMSRTLYARAEEIAADDPVFLQQRAIYEMNRENGNLTNAEGYLIAAQKLAPNNTAIAHSRAELELRRAEAARTDLEFQTLAAVAEKEVRAILNRPQPEPVAYHTLLKLQLLRLRRVLAEPNEPAIQMEFVRLVRATEDVLSQALQLFPEHNYLLDAEAQFAELLADDARAQAALASAFEQNKANSYLAHRYGRYLASHEHEAEALEVYRAGIEASPNDKLLHFAYARLLMALRSDEVDEIQYHLYHSFTEGDKNYEAKFWYARLLFLLSRYEDSNRLFQTLATVPVPFDTKRQVRGIVETPTGEPQMFQGRITKLEPTYAFIARDGVVERIFVHRSKVPEGNWTKLYLNQRVSFSLGFTFTGPAAAAVVIV